MIMEKLMSSSILEAIGGIIVPVVPRIVAGVLILLGFWIASLFARKIIHRLWQGRVVNPDVADLLEQGLHLALLLVGAISALGTVGIDISALVAGLGLTGFALGFALRDALSNFLAGILILVYQPFERSDRITVAGQTGTVIDIDLRYLTLESKGKRILVPNSTAFNNVVIVETEGA